MALNWFCKDISVPLNLIVNTCRYKTFIKVNRFCDQVGTIFKILGMVTLWVNRAELYIGLLKEAVRKDICGSHSPKVLWYYAIECRYLIHNKIPCMIFHNMDLLLIK